MVANNIKMSLKKFRWSFRKSYNINAIKIASKQAIVEVASMSGG